MGQPSPHIGPALRESRRAPHSHEMAGPPDSSTFAPRPLLASRPCPVGLYTPRGHRCPSFYPLCKEFIYFLSQDTPSQQASLVLPRGDNWCRIPAVSGGGGDNAHPPLTEPPPLHRNPKGVLLCTYMWGRIPTKNSASIPSPSPFSSNWRRLRRCSGSPPLPSFSDPHRGTHPTPPLLGQPSLRTSPSRSGLTELPSTETPPRPRLRPSQRPPRTMFGIPAFGFHP